MDNMNLNDYRQFLRNIIADPKNGLILNAEIVLGEDGKEKRVEGASFELSSGKYQREYVTLWGLFDKSMYFDECIDQLAKLAREIRSKNNQWYSAIVTCTSTAKHIVEHLHAKIESEEEEEEIEIYYLSPYPYHSLDDYRLLDFREKRVLITHLTRRDEQGSFLVKFEKLIAEH